MDTSLIALAMASLLSGSPSATPAVWRSDYHAARDEAARLNKPLAVVIGTGENGWQKIAKDEFARPVTAAFRPYVCVYINLDTRTGRRLAEEFELDDGPAMVLSDRGGDRQAFRRFGSLPEAELRRVLDRFSDPDRVVRETERSGLRLVTPPPVPPPAFTPASLNQCLT
jgi:hypothetical protein